MNIIPLEENECDWKSRVVVSFAGIHNLNIYKDHWMDLETVIQIEVNQKEKSKYCILMHICGI